MKQFELSRKLLLNDPQSGGFVALDEQVPAYLPDAGNDYSFASMQYSPISEPILVRLKNRCIACHGTTGLHDVMSFRVHAFDPVPPVALLKPSDNDHARYVIERKMQRPDFKALQEGWK